MGYRTFEYHGPTPYTSADRDHFAGQSEEEMERERKESLEAELKELRLVLIEEICGEIESELSVIEPGVCWRPNDLDDDKLWRLAEAAVCKAKQIKGVVEALREL